MVTARYGENDTAMPLLEYQCSLIGYANWRYDGSSSKTTHDI